MNDTQIAVSPGNIGASGSRRSFIANLIIVTASVSLVVWALQLLHTRLTSVISRDAVINGALIDINAPISGDITGLPVTTGAAVSADQALFTIQNARLDELPIQEIQSQIRDKEAELDRAVRRLGQLQDLYREAVTDQGSQYTLEVAQARDSIDQAKNELGATQAQYELSNRNYKSAQMLFESGAISKADFDEAQLEREQYINQVRASEARLRAEYAKQSSAEQSLSLSGYRGNYDLKVRRRDLESDIVDQQKVVEGLRRSIQNAKAELERAQKDFALKNKAEIKAPVSGVVYSINARKGQYVEQGTLLGKALDCNRRWVDVFVDEREVQRLSPGIPATIELYGTDSRTLQGRISLIRSGLGRLAAGQDVAVPIAENMPRMTQVRVDLEASTEAENPDVMCYVGYTGKVSFRL